MKLWRLFLIIHGSFLLVLGDRSCLWSKQTVEKVDSCPMNKSAVEQRTKEKNCEAYAKLQNCTNPLKFLYHCVINEYSNATIEVCAPVYIINGFCTEYNTAGARIQPHYNLRCSDLTPPCADRYNSTDAYLYKGCFAKVNQGHVTSSDNGKMPNSSDSSISGQRPTTENTGTELEMEIVIVIVFISIALSVVATVVIIIIKRRKRPCQTISTTSPKDSAAVIPLLHGENRNTNQPTVACISSKDHCEETPYESVISRGKILSNMHQLKKDDLSAKMQANHDKTISYLKDFGQVDAKYVETSLTKECESRLHSFGLIVLIGEQGSGKTSTAVHIMNKPKYDDWTKHKITSWVDLLAFKFEEKTFIYADNLFDGFLYQQEVDKWWDTLCFFYFKYIKPANNIRLIITAKDDVVCKVCEFSSIDIQKFDETCFVRVESFPLTGEEKIKILENQISLAKYLKGIDVHIIAEKMKSDLKEKNCPLGFPLCAHLYAFEKKPELRTDFIFDHPRQYVRLQVKAEIENEKSVKTLFLLLLYYFSPETTNKQLDLNDKKKCKTFFDGPLAAEMVEEMQLNFEDNLHEKATNLEETVLIKHNSMFEFKHQIYLQGVSDYFFGAHFAAAVKYFPLSILRTFRFKDISKDKTDQIVDRLKREIDEKSISDALSCNCFKERAFEQEFCDSLYREKSKMTELLSAYDKTSRFKLPITFWASKYHLTILSNMMLKFANENKKDDCLHFYLARLGECCAEDESYITKIERVEDAENLVKKFRTSNGETILQLILSSNKSDAEAYYQLDKILTESNRETLPLDKTHLNCVLNQNKHSRLRCLLLLLDKLPNELIGNGEKINIEKAPPAIQELELLCRICILAVHGVKITKKTAKAFFGDRNYFSKIGAKKEQDMAKRITDCIKNLNECPDSAYKGTPNQLLMKMTVPLQKAIKDSIGIFALKDANIGIQQSHNSE